MPYADIAKQREYQRLWMAKRRRDYLDDHPNCVKCGSTEGLEVDHIDRSTKVDHKVWSWAEKKREEELKKCQVLCHVCHRDKTTAETRALVGPWVHGSNAYKASRCRCDICRDANAAYNRAYRAKLRAA